MIYEAEKTINNFCNLLISKNWSVTKSEQITSVLPKCIISRYKNISDEYSYFLVAISECVNSDQTAWLICNNDYERQDEDAFKWNEFAGSYRGK